MVSERNITIYGANATSKFFGGGGVQFENEMFNSAC